MSNTRARFKIVWHDGFDRESIAEHLLVENLGEAEANAICARLCRESTDESDWWLVKPQDAHVWRGMGEFV